MKILYVSTSTDMGGAETSLRSLVWTAKEAGHEVKIISLKPLGSIGKDLQKKGFDIISFDLQGKWNPFENMGVLARLIREIQEYNPSVVHAILYRAIEFCRLAKRKISFHLFTTPHHDLSRKNYFLRILDRVLKESDTISCAESKSTFDFLIQKQKYDKKKVFLIENGINTSFFEPNTVLAKKEREKMGILKDEIVFVCVARLSFEKNHQIILESFEAVKAKNPKIRLILVGDGPENANLRQFVRNHNLEKNVIFTGEVSNVYPFLLVSDVFLMTSFVESLPVSLLEACSCSLPTIVSKVGDMPLVVKHGVNGFVFNGKDPVLLTVLMVELIRNDVLRKKMGKASRKLIKEKYSCSEKKYLELYQKK